MYEDEEKLELVNSAGLTERCHALVKEEKLRLKGEGRKVSISKLVCNLIIKDYGTRNEES